VFKIIVQADLNNKYLNHLNNFQVFSLCAFVIIGKAKFLS